MKRPNFRKGGFTLVELVFVIAIILVLASIFLPLAVSKLNKTDEIVADASIQEIAAALTAFYEDIRHFPTCDSTDCDPLTGSNNNLIFLAFGDGFSDLTASYPSTTSGTDQWDLTVNDSATPARNNGANHLAINDPVANGTPNQSGTDYETATTQKKRWRGPYIARLGADPWGKSFIAYVGAMENSGSLLSGQTNTHFGWILSAGPDNSLDTRPSATNLQNDDRGFIFHTD